MLIIIEGKYDSGFLEIYLQYLKIKDYKFFEVGGNSSLANKLEGGKENLRTQIDRTIAKDKKIKIIFDADNDINKSKQNIEKQLGNELYSKCEVFLFPNNQDKGNLEDLFLKIAKEKSILECLRRSRECLEKIDSKLPNFKSPDKKAVVYAYTHMFGGVIKNGKIKVKGDILEILDLDHEYLEPLKNFLLR